MLFLWSLLSIFLQKYCLSIISNFYVQIPWPSNLGEKAFILAHSTRFTALCCIYLSCSLINKTWESDIKVKIWQIKEVVEEWPVDPSLHISLTKKEGSKAWDSPSPSPLLPVPLYLFPGSSMFSMANFCQLVFGSAPLFKVHFINIVSGYHGVTKHPTAAHIGEVKVLGT